MAINRTLTATIPANQVATDIALNVGTDRSQPLTLVGLITPPTLNGDNIAIEVDNGSGSFVPLNRDGNIISVDVQSDNAYALDPVTFAGWKTVRLVARTGGSPTPQATDTTLTLVAREVS